MEIGCENIRIGCFVQSGSKKYEGVLKKTEGTIIYLNDEKVRVGWGWGVEK